ncbi:RCC1 and BTB domain-containing protein 1 [Atta colombica]|uniref:RCC1 and BTB domain-containing protein 1 n=1 Tax=Atta colombica TaxID=520822 RepID=A0A195BRV7_9HYME|nr:RCC1 and BTB domain-containing protein 1 [Atta colombica]
MCTTLDLCRWPILSSLESAFVSQIHMVFVFGRHAQEALIITRDKMVYGLGDNIAGCLGIGNTNCTLFPKKVEILCGKDIKTFAYSNGPNILALTKEGEIVTPTLVNIPNLENSPGTKRIVDIACGGFHSVALTEIGEFDLGIYLGNKRIRTTEYHYINDTPPQVISSLATKKVVYFSCGATFTMAVTENGEVYSWGNNNVGQLGIGKCENQTLPYQISTLSGIVIVKVVCGTDYTLALTNKGDLYLYTNCLKELIEKKKTEDFNVEHQMGRVSDIAAMHNKFISIAVGQDGRVYVWGKISCNKCITIPCITPFSNVYNALACYANVMHEPLILYSNEEPNILKHLELAFDDPSTSDLKIQVEGQYIHVHKAILKIRSTYFKIMFQHNWAENNQNVIEHDQFSYVVYKAFLKYLYTDVIDLSQENTLELLALANAYCENNLKKYCIQMIKQRIMISNAAFLYSITFKYKEEELEELCFKFAMNHLTAVTQTENFANLDHNVMKTLIIKASKVGSFEM